MTLIAFGLSLFSHMTFRLLASLGAFLAAVLTLIAFAIDIALFAYVKHQMSQLTGATLTTKTAPGLRAPEFEHPHSTNPPHSFLDDFCLLHFADIGWKHRLLWSSP